MKIEEHPEFRWPDNQGTKIWRYMDLSKFVSLLMNRALFFSRVSLFDDPFEGSATHATIANEAGKPVGNRTELFRAARSHILACCWHTNDHESEAMWKLYSHISESVAIQSTFSRLADCLPAYCLAGLVEYLDYKEDAYDRMNLFSGVMHKRKSFEHERELRAVVWSRIRTQQRLESASEPELLLQPSAAGLQVPVDLAALIEQVIVNPLAPGWFFDLVVDLTRRYDADLTVKPSDLAQNPVW